MAARDAETLFAAWQASLAAAGYTAGAATTVGDDTRQFWSLDARRVNIATGVVDTTAYVFAEDQQLLPSGAIVAGTTDDAVRLLLTAHAPATVVEAAPAEARSHGDTPGKNHAFSPTKGKGTSFTPAGDGKSGGKKPGGKGKGKKSEPTAGQADLNYQEAKQRAETAWKSKPTAGEEDPNSPRSSRYAKHPHGADEQRAAIKAKAWGNLSSMGSYKETEF